VVAMEKEDSFGITLLAHFEYYDNNKIANL
jgi:hypothetical protein